MTWIDQLPRIELWKKYSQGTEEAYIDFILQNVKPIKCEVDILELGASHGFNLSNTRYFIEQEQKALLIDGDGKSDKEIKHHVITKENALSIISQYNMPQNFNLFFIDLGGNDIYIIEEVLSKYKPRIIIAAFNPIWAQGESYAIKYNPNYIKSDDDYYGFSFEAGIKMGEKFSYTCIFQSDSTNMYFVENNALAESLGIEVCELLQYVQKPEYKQTFYHPKSTKADWVEY